MNNISNNEIILKILGTQSPFCKENCAGPSYYIKYKNTKILLDCGSGSHRFFDIKDLDNLNIFISHLHFDHFCDVYNYIYSSHSLQRLKVISEPVNVYLPTYQFNIYSAIKSCDLGDTNFYDIDEYKTYNLTNNVNVDFCKLEHSSFIENFATRVKIENKTIVYTGDMSFNAKDTLIKFAKDADILICEASLLREHNFPEICGHLTAYQAGLIAKSANVKKLILTHFWANENTEKYFLEAKKVFSNVYIAKEKDCYKI